jgi:hypothetical protein
LKKKTNCIIIKKNFSEIHKNDFDILMVNSDQTWRKFGDKFFYDHGFLRFARKWNITKFVYGASLGYNHWKLTKNDEIIIKNLLTNFKGLSVREKGSIELIQKHLGFKPILVLDPTLLIDKKYYLNLLRDYKGAKPTNNNYIFTYLIIAEKNIRTFIKNASEELDYEIFNVYKSDNNSIIKFIYGVVHSKAVITDSFHGTAFSLNFEKPFCTICKPNGSSEYRKVELLNKFGCEDVLVYDVEQLKQLPEIKFTEDIRKKKQVLIDYSKRKLQMAIEE